MRCKRERYRNRESKVIEIASGINVFSQVSGAEISTAEPRIEIYNSVKTTHWLRRLSDSTNRLCGLKKKKSHGKHRFRGEFAIYRPDRELSNFVLLIQPGIFIGSLRYTRATFILSLKIYLTSRVFENNSQSFSLEFILSIIYPNCRRKILSKSEW